MHNYYTCSQLLFDLNFARLSLRDLSEESHHWSAALQYSYSVVTESRYLSHETITWYNV